METKDIDGFDGLYEVTDTGEVWSLEKRVFVGSNGGARVQPRKKLTPQPHGRSGHLRVYLYKGGKKTPIFVHRLVAIAFIANPLNKPVVNHLDGDVTNNHVANLEWCSVAENNWHAVKNGLSGYTGVSGERNGAAKLTVDTVRTMREQFRHGLSCAEIARRANVNPRHAWGICHRKLWQHID